MESKEVSDIKRIIRLVSAMVVLVLMAGVVLNVSAISQPPFEHLGDVTRNGTINTTDARLVLQYAVGLIETPAAGGTRSTLIGDADLDGDVDTTDARLILQHAVGKINKQNRKLGVHVPWSYTEDADGGRAFYLNFDAVKRS